MPVSFVIHGDPRGKGRPRFGKRGRHMVAYTDAKTATYEKQVQAAAQSVMAGRPPYEGAVWVRINAFYPIPKSAPKYKKALMRDGKMRPAKKPDLDNVNKAILDGLNTIAFNDDAQVCGIGSTKFYSDHTRVEVTVGPIGEISHG